MSILKKAGLGALGAVAVALAYPGIPCGVTLRSNDNSAELICYYLHWTGMRTRDIDLTSQMKNGSISSTNGPCYHWANWNPNS